MIMLLAALILLIVFILIAVRQVGGLRLQIWQIMGAGALVALITRQIAPDEALGAINMDVMVFLFCMFMVGRAMEESGYLSYLSHKIFSLSGTRDQALLLILFGAGFASAFLMNDTLAIVGTPVVLLLSDRHGISPKPLLIALAFAVTIGSVMSPIGNPQNLLIAIDGGIPNPFVSFWSRLLIPTMINLFLAFALLKIFYAEEFGDRGIIHSEGHVVDDDLAMLSKISLCIIAVLIVAKITLSFLGFGNALSLTMIAVAAALPIAVFSPKRLDIARTIDYHTLLFFAAMFVLMESVWSSGFFQSILAGLSMDMGSVPAILDVSVILSQFISNVPLVALYLPTLTAAGAGTNAMLALAAGSTIAGNLTILGAASNVIIIQNAEKKGKTVTFWEFARIGIPMTIINIIVYWLFLASG